MACQAACKHRNERIGELCAAFPVFGHTSWLDGNGFAWRAGGGEYAIGEDLVVMAAWGIAAVLVALRFFTWEPRGLEKRGRGRRRRRAAEPAA